MKACMLELHSVTVPLPPPKKKKEQKPTTPYLSHRSMCFALPLKYDR